LGTLATTAVLGVSTRAGDPSSGGKPGQTKHTKFAVNVEAWWTKLPFLERLEKTAELGFPAVEFWPWENKDIPAVAKACERLKIEVAQFTAWGFKPGLNDPKNHDDFVKKIEKSCTVAQQLNCKMMTVVGGDDVKGMTQEQMHQNIIEGLKRAAPIAEKHKVMLILEPMNIRVDHKGHCLYGSEKTVKICRAVGSPFVKINWDLYHMHISEGDLCGHLKEGFDQLGYVQIADHPGRKEPGTGEIYYPRVFRQLKELGYKGLVGLELWPIKDELTAAWAVHKADQW
jgi:hydroxypyruvate isomerase